MIRVSVLCGWTVGRLPLGVVVSRTAQGLLSPGCSLAALAPTPVPAGNTSRAGLPWTVAGSPGGFPRRAFQGPGTAEPDPVLMVPGTGGKEQGSTEHANQPESVGKTERLGCSGAYPS